MKSFCIALFFALVALVCAQSSNDSPFYITYPLSGTVLKAGESIDLAWNNGLDQTVKVVVIQGPNANTMSPSGITFNVQGDDGSYTWTVPKSLAPSGTFAFQFEYKGDNGATQYAYSGPVSVSGGTGTVGSVSATASSASASSAASSSAASSSASSSAVSSSSAAVSSSSSSAASSSAASSSKTTTSASVTPSPSNAASGLTITSLALAVPALMMVALTA